MLCTLALLISKEKWKEKELWSPYLPLCFYAIIFCTNSWLAEGSNTSKKRYNGIPQSSVFLRMLSVCILSKFWFEWKAFKGHQCPCLFSLRCTTFTIAHFETRCAPMLCSAPEFCVYVASQMPNGNEAARNDQLIDITHTSFVQTCASLSHHTSLTKPKCKHKIIKISRQQQQNIKPSVGPF